MKLKFRATPKDITTFAVFAIILLYFVSIGVINAVEFLGEGHYTLSPIRAFTTDLFAPVMVFFVAFLILIFTGVTSFFFDREKGIGIKASPKEEKGYSRWATTKEMKKNLKLVDAIHPNSEYAGIPLINDGKQLWVDDGEYHSLIIGSTGSGKTQMMVLPLVRVLAKKGESMIVTDPKGELYEKTATELKSRGYNIVLLNFRDPQKGNCWNPFDLPYSLYKNKNTDKATELLEDLAQNILYDEQNKGNDPFWENASADYFAGLSLALFDDADELEINLNSINLMSTIGEEKIGGTTYMKEFFSDKDESSPAYVNVSSTLMAPSETKGSILSVFKQKIKMFSSREHISEMLSHSDFDMKDIGRKKTAVFIVIQDEKKTYHPLVTIFIKQCYESLIDVAQENGGKLQYRTNFILDEFANMPPLKHVTTMVTAARSRNIRFDFIIQNFSQLNDVYGKENAETIKGNCGNIIYLLSTELAALEEISKLCGEIKSKDKEKTASRPLITVSDLQHLKEGEIVVLRVRERPFKTKVVYDWKMDWGVHYEKAEYPIRESEPIHLFDIKKIVESKRQKKINEMLGSVGKNNESIKTPAFGNMPFPPGNSSMPFPSGSKSNPGLNVDDLIKRIDAKIAEYEEEERKEKEKLAKQQAIFVDDKKQPKPNVEPIKQSESLKEVPSFSELVDSKGLLDKNQVTIAPVQKVAMPQDLEEITDDQFFDDFFYDEDE